MGSITFQNISSSLRRKNMSSYLIYIQIKSTSQPLCLSSYLVVNPEYQVHAEVDQTTP